LFLEESVLTGFMIALVRAADGLEVVSLYIPCSLLPGLKPWVTAISPLWGKGICKLMYFFDQWTGTL
jgi:hypothetical protein